MLTIHSSAGWKTLRLVRLFAEELNCGIGPDRALFF
jgi:hypothetical protein